MDIENLRIFCLVVEEGSISQAVKHLYLSQPGATRKIQQLEDYYNASLFDRENGKLSVSEAGKVLYPMAKSMVTEFDHSREMIRQMTEKSQIHLNIGASPTIGEYLLPELLGEFKKRNPDFQINLVISNTPTIISRLLGDSVDLALVEGIVENKEQLHVKKLMDDVLYLVCSPHHHWSRRNEIKVEELVEERMIWREETSGTRAIIEKFLRAAGILDQINYYMELGSTQAIKGAVEANLGVSILPDIAISREVAQRSLCKIRIADLELKRQFMIVQRKQRFEQVGFVKLLELIREKLNK